MEMYLGLPMDEFDGMEKRLVAQADANRPAYAVDPLGRVWRTKADRSGIYLIGDVNVLYPPARETQTGPWKP
jgi:hypothetical protein